MTVNVLKTCRRAPERGAPPRTPPKAGGLWKPFFESRHGPFPMPDRCRGWNHPWPGIQGGWPLGGVQGRSPANGLVATKMNGPNRIRGPRGKPLGGVLEGAP